MVAGVATVDGVVAVGVGELAEVLVGVHEGFGVFCHIAVVYVVVGRTMDDEQTAAQVLGTRDRTAIIAFGVLLGCAHETLGVDGVVVAP